LYRRYNHGMFQTHLIRNAFENGLKPALMEVNC
jgi:hypothetical protein